MGEIRRVKNGEQAVGNKTRVKVVKNKVAPPFRECTLELVPTLRAHWLPFTCSMHEGQLPRRRHRR
jgi:hypothetical protein